MIPDILGFTLNDGIDLLNKSGFEQKDIVIIEYSSPKGDKIGNDRRIVRVDSRSGKILLLTCNF